MLKMLSKTKQMFLTEPKITIITINYNNAAGLRDTLRSVINQTYSNVEYIVVDRYLRKINRPKGSLLQRDWEFIKSKLL